MNELLNQREAVANAFFDDFIFYDQVEASSGWEYTTPGREISKLVFIEALKNDNQEDDDNAGTERVVFKVVFKNCDSAEVEEVYALYMSSGNYAGRPGSLVSVAGA
jgi:hypothetical protein